MRRFQRMISYPLQAVGALVIYGFFRVLPMDWASGTGSWLGRMLGPALGFSSRARRSLRLALPDLSGREVSEILAGMWDNLGRVLGELPHIDHIAATRVEISGTEHLAAVRAEGVPCIFFSAHLANWEVFALAARRIGIPYVQIYRAANNPFVDVMLRRFRRLEEEDIVPKGPRGARDAIATLKAGRRLGMLVDQKMNDGIAVPFFGRPAMTAPALAQLAQRYGCPVIPARMERLDGCRFRLTFYPAIKQRATGDRAADTAAMMGEVNQMLEGWIREHPDQWLWLHRRWPES
jgi:KDO2-lipid IV(A) lauroyltransferase